MARAVRAPGGRGRPDFVHAGMTWGLANGWGCRAGDETKQAPETTRGKARDREPRRGVAGGSVERDVLGTASRGALASRRRRRLGARLGRAARKRQPNAPRIQLVARGERHVLGVHVHLIYRPGGLVHRHRLRRGDARPVGPLRAQARERARGRRGGGPVHVAILRSHHSGGGVTASRGRLDARRERRARARHHQGFRRGLASEAVKRNDGATGSALRALWRSERKTHDVAPRSRDL